MYINIYLAIPFAEADRIWFYAENETILGAQELRGAVFELALPSLRAKVWRLPAFRHDSEGRRVFDLSGLCVDAEHIYLARSGEYFAVCDRQNGKWQVLDQVRPYGDVFKVGDACYFLTGESEDRGLARYTPQDGKIELLGGSRRTTHATPLDDSAITAFQIKPGADGALEIFIEEKTVRLRSGRGSSGPLLGILAYHPATRQWSTVQKPAENGLYRPFVFTPLKQPGPAKAYQETIRNDAWTLQLANDAMPKARIPLKFLDAPGSSPGSIPAGNTECFWCSQGYILAGSDEDRRTLWFLPQGDVDAYLRKYVPKMDETKSIPPIPSLK